MESRLFTHLYNHIKKLGIDPDKLIGLQGLTDKTLKEILAIQDKKRVEEILSVYQNLHQNFDDEVVKHFEDLPFDENWTDFANIILKAKGGIQAFYAIIAAIDKDVLASGHAVEIVTALANAKGTYEVEYAWRVAVDKDVLASEHAVEIVKAVANAKGKKQAGAMVKLIRKGDILKHKYCVQLLQMISHEEDENILNQYLEYLWDKINIYIDLSDNQDGIMKKFISRMRKGNRAIEYRLENFWDVYEKYPNQIMTIIEENNSSLDIESETKVLVKSRTKNNK